MTKAWYLAGAAAVAAATALAQTPSPPREIVGEGHEEQVTGILGRSCSGCHAAERVWDVRHTEEGWAEVIDRMIALGAPLEAPERRLLIDYLTLTRGPEQQDAGAAASVVATAAPAAGAGDLLANIAARPAMAAALQGNCCEAPAAEYPKVGGNYGNHNYSSLAQITPASIGQLGAAWHVRLEGGDETAFQQGNLVALNGVIYAETTQGSTIALDGKTGRELWRYNPGLSRALRRGVAVGGGKVFTVKGGNRVVALDQASGTPVWEMDFSEERTLGTMPTALTYFGGIVLLGTADSRRGAAFGLDAETGQVAWKFYGAPGEGEFGNDTWAGDSWVQGGAAPWLNPAIDPARGLVYWTFGNPRGGGGPLDGSAREGINLFSDSMVAFDIRTGRRVWHFQSVHHDIWDLDNVMAPVLVDLTIEGVRREAVVYGSKSAMVFVLDRATGEPILPVEERPVPQLAEQHTWPTQPYSAGEPLTNLCPTGVGAGRVPPNYQSACLYTPHWDELIVHYPGTGGGGDTSQYSYSHRTGLLYAAAGIVGTAQARTGSNVGTRPPGQERSGMIIAYDLARGRKVWERPNEWALAHGNGVLSTAGNLLFHGQPDGYLVALDATDGTEVWRFQTGAGVHTQAISYEIDGEQYVAVVAGGNGLPYNSPKGDHLWAFRLGGSVPPAPTPAPPSRRQPVIGEVVAGTDVDNVIVLGRAWAEGRVGAEEVRAQNAMAPAILRVPAGTTVTFRNPADNRLEHCATQFFEGLFNRKLKPGESFDYQFTTPGEYYFNDCAFPLATGKVIVE